MVQLILVARQKPCVLWDNMPSEVLSERFWKFFKRKILYNAYYEKFSEFEDAATAFFDDLEKYRDDLRSLLTENFEIVPTLTLIAGFNVVTGKVHSRQAKEILHVGSI